MQPSCFKKSELGRGVASGVWLVCLTSVQDLALPREEVEQNIVGSK